MRFRLRTLLIVLAVGPMVLAGAWNWEQVVNDISLPMPLGVAIGISLFTLVGLTLLNAAVCLLEYMAEVLGQIRR